MVIRISILIYETLDEKFNAINYFILCRSISIYVRRYFCTIMSELSLLKSRPLTPYNSVLRVS